MDGTLSILRRTPGDMSTTITSRKPGGSFEPLAPLKRAVTNGGSDVGNWEAVSDEEADANYEVTANNEAVANDEAVADDEAIANSDHFKIDSHGNWAHICSYLKRVVPIPCDDKLVMLFLQFPRLRPLELTVEITTHLDTEQLSAMLIYIVGVERQVACQCCRENTTPFPRCVTLSGPKAKQGYRLQGSRRHTSSCATCLLRHAAGIRLCSLISSPGKDGVAVWDSGKKFGARPAPGDRVVPMPDNDGGNQAEDDGENEGNVGEDGLFHRRRSKRRRRGSESGFPSTRGAPSSGQRAEVSSQDMVLDAIDVVVPDLDDDSDYGNSRAPDVEGTSDEEDQEPKRRILTLRIPDGIRSAVASLQQQHDSFSSELQGEKYLAAGASAPSELGTDHIAAPGGIGAAATIKHLGVNINKSIKLSDDDVSAIIYTIPCNTTCLLSADSTEKLACTVVCGELRVKTPDTGSEFQIVTWSVFTIPPGVECVVENRGYVEAFLQIITLKQL